MPVKNCTMKKPMFLGFIKRIHEFARLKYSDVIVYSCLLSCHYNLKCLRDTNFHMCN